MEGNKKYYRHRVEPFNDVYVNVDLCDAVIAWNSSDTHPKELSSVFRWLDEGKARLRVFSPIHYLSQDAAKSIPAVALECGGSGTSHHQGLVALAKLFLEACGAKVCASGRCAYAASCLADACIPEERYFVECGTLDTNKPYQALSVNSSLLILPYALGVERTPELESVLGRIVDTPPTDTRISENRRWSVQFAFELRPVDGKPRAEHLANLFKNNATEGL